MFSTLKYYFFLFRWFLIDKYHCDAPRWCKRCYWFINKLLWLLIVVSVSVTLGTFIEEYLL